MTGQPHLDSAAFGQIAEDSGELVLVRAAEGHRPAAWPPGRQRRSFLMLKIARGKIVAIDLIADPERLPRLDLKILDD